MLSWRNCFLVGAEPGKEPRALLPLDVRFGCRRRKLPPPSTTAIFLVGCWLTVWMVDCFLVFGTQITGLADRVGVGVYFNPFVEWRDKVSWIALPCVRWRCVPLTVRELSTCWRNLSFDDAEDKVWGGEDEGPGDGCLDLGQVLPQWPAAETCMNVKCFVLQMYKQSHNAGFARLGFCALYVLVSFLDHGSSYLVWLWRYTFCLIRATFM